jgi:hypothetical protein
MLRITSTSGLGPKLTSSDVRSLDAVGGTADMARAHQFGRD